MSVLDHYDYVLPDHCIARYPSDKRDHSRLMLLPRAGGDPTDAIFHELVDALAPGDLLVANDTRVIPARVMARRPTGGKAELLVLQLGADGAPSRALARPAKKLKPGMRLTLDRGGEAEVIAHLEAPGEVLVHFDEPVMQALERAGDMPLPPYLSRPAEPSDAERYQTVFANHPGSAAAPTAGLHFTEDLLARLGASGVGFATVTLHVGLGTFRPLTPEDVARGTLHEERWWVSDATVDAIERTKAAGGRVIAVGTTSARTLESATPDGAHVPVADSGSTRLFIQPGYRFKCVDGLITNFHLPRSSLLMLVAALCGRERLLSAYEHAITNDYRFYSYGDAMLLL